jgi:hypothetical protein
MDPKNGAQKWTPEMDPENGPKNESQKWTPKLDPKHWTTDLDPHVGAKTGSTRQPLKKQTHDMVVGHKTTPSKESQACNESQACQAEVIVKIRV